MSNNTKYGHLIGSDDDDSTDDPPEWRDRTSVDHELEVTLHEQGYQNDRRWTIYLVEDHSGSLVARYAAEHQNKGNFWRSPTLWRDAVDFEDLPWPVRKRAADAVDRSVADLTPEERVITREDGTGLWDRERDTTDCGVCGQPVHGDRDKHPDCVEVPDRD